MGLHPALYCTPYLISVNVVILTGTCFYSSNLFERPCISQNAVYVDVLSTDIHRCSMWIPRVSWQVSPQILLIMSTSMAANASVIRASSSSKFAGRSGMKLLFLTYHHTEKTRGVKSGDHGGQAVSTTSNPSYHPPRPIQAFTHHG